MSIAIRASWWCRALGLALVGLIVALIVPSRTARADMLFFKDGFAVEGRVKREMEVEFDKVAGEAYYMPKGFIYLDDGARRIFFSQSQVRLVYPKDPPSEERIIRVDTRMQFNPKKLPEFLGVVKAPEWDDKWDRRFQFRSPLRIENVPQHIGLLTPHWARVDSRGNYFWACAYLTREFGPETVRKLLNSHPDFREKKDMPPAQRASLRLRKADFFAQAGWFDLAETELDRLLSDIPDQKERVETARKTLVNLRARDRLEDIKRRHLAGQHQLVSKRLADFPTKGVPEAMIAQVDELKSEYETNERLLKETSRLLDKARREATSAHGRLLAEAAAFIGANLGFENVGRLDAFLGQARQAERLQKKGKKSEVGPEQLLSLAVSGWLMGSASAETSPETAVRLWRGQEMVRKYLRTDDPENRKAILQAHKAQSQKDAASLDELIQIIRQLPPIEAEAKLPEKTTERKPDSGSYLLRLPPGYRHSRPHPVLIVLHNSGEDSPGDMIERWAEPAAQHGYILVAPQWHGGGLGSDYSYSEREHGVVLGALRDLKRHFNVDEDRVFLFGMGEGGAMAFDVGLGHPDLFAGVLPMAAGPRYHAAVGWRNGQYLPFYVVHGTHGPNGADVRKQFESWVQRGFPMLWVDYKGRGVEWFSGELPNMFDWMRGQRRVFPMRQLGTDGQGGMFGNEFCTLRACDNHFYWLSADDIFPNFLNRGDGWKPPRQPATLHARIEREDNWIFVRTSGVKRATLWLGRNGKGKDMIDFDKQVKLTFNLSIPRMVTVKPSIDVLLEDLYQRGDRQQLFFAKIELPLAR
jgi:predicted esterase